MTLIDIGLMICVIILAGTCTRLRLHVNTLEDVYVILHRNATLMHSNTEVLRRALEDAGVDVPMCTCVEGEKCTEVGAHRKTLCE